MEAASNNGCDIILFHEMFNVEIAMHGAGVSGSGRGHGMEFGKPHDLTLWMVGSIV